MTKALRIANAAVVLSLKFAAAVALTSVLASVFSSQFVMAGLTDLGVRIPLSARLYMTTADLGILPMMLMAFSISLLVGFSIAGICVLKGGNPSVWFAMGGSIAIISQLLILESIFGSMPIAGARSALGLVFQGVAGAIGGWLFARLATRPGMRES